VRTALRRYRRSLLGLVAHAAYEGETRAFVREFLVEALGFPDQALESPPARTRADYGLRVGADLVALVEIRRVANRLDEPRLRELHSSATAPWLVLTNAVEWHLYHLGAPAGAPVTETPIIQVHLLAPLALAKKSEVLVHLTRESFEHGATASLLLAQRALSPECLSAALTSVGVLRATQSELRRTTGQPIETKAIAEAVRAMLTAPQEP
jgi:hypothetical protein